MPFVCLIQEVFNLGMYLQGNGGIVMKTMKTDMYNKVTRMSESEVLNYFNSTRTGLTEKQVLASRKKYGSNKIIKTKKENMIIKTIKEFMNPFVLVLLALGIISFGTDYLFTEDKDLMTVFIIGIMIIISGTLNVLQTLKVTNEMNKLHSLVKMKAMLVRDKEEPKDTDMEELVVGDIIKLSAGDMILADARVLESKDLFISQASLTGESKTIEKVPSVYQKKDNRSMFDYKNLLFTGSNVISGSATAVVINVGEKTTYGNITSNLVQKKPQTSFEKGISEISLLLIRFMIVMVVLVLAINAYNKQDYLEATLFALSVAVGLTPEMLPMIVSTNMAKGASKISKQGSIIKNLNTVQNFGAIDVLCTDKTGTLTMDHVVLEYHRNVNDETSKQVLEDAFLNSHFQTGLKNLLDEAIVEACKKSLKIRIRDYQKIDEIPFDFKRRKMSVIIKNRQNRIKLITKGAIEEILDISTHAEVNGKVVKLNKEIKDRVLESVDKLNEDGFRVVGLATKDKLKKKEQFSVKDEEDMTLIGYLAFLDPPKKSAMEAIKTLNDNSVTVKVFTGDNERVTKAVCEKVGIDSDKVIYGQDTEKLNDKAVYKILKDNNIFVKLSPHQKQRLVRILRKNGHVVGFLGDGINDALSLKEADVGISVDTAVDISKESADVILLKKDLMILERGIIEGRKVFVNTVKYVNFTISSNFGNALSVLLASIFLPFLPILPIQALLLNLIYDTSCLALPWDNVDPENLVKPLKWEAKNVSSFMRSFGIISSVFDIISFLVFYFIFIPNILGGTYHQLNADQQSAFQSLFHNGWFLVSLFTQTLVIQFLRTDKKPFIESMSAKVVMISAILALVIGTIIPFTAASRSFGFTRLPASFYPYFIVIIVGYIACVLVIKHHYLKKHHSLF